MRKLRDYKSPKPTWFIDVDWRLTNPYGGNATTWGRDTKKCGKHTAKPKKMMYIWQVSHIYVSLQEGEESFIFESN